MWREATDEEVMVWLSGHQSMTARETEHGLEVYV